MVRDAKAFTDLVDHFNPPNEEQKSKARRTVSYNAKGDTHEDKVNDATEMMRMLGLLPLDLPDEPSLTPSPTWNTRQ